MRQPSQNPVILSSVPEHALFPYLQTLFLVTESLFFISLFWQTRLDLSQFWPQFFSLPVVSDYIKPFIYLNQLLFISSLLLWLVIYHRYLAASLARVLNNIKTNDRGQARSLIINSVLWLIIAGSLTLISLLVNHPQWWNWFTLMTGVGGIVFATYMYIRFRQGLFYRFLYILCLSIFFQHLLIISQWMIQSSLGLQWLGEWRTTVHTPGVAKVIMAGHEYLRPHGTFAHPNLAGLILALTWLPGLISLKHLSDLYSGLSAYRNWIFLIWTLVSFLAILLTFSRLAWLVLAIHSLALLVYYLKVHPPKYHRLPKLKSTLIGLVLLLILSLSLPFVLPRLTSLYTYDHLTVDRRLQLNHIAVQQIQQSPLLGLGLANHIISVYQVGPLYGVGIWRQPVHNIYLLTATQTGIPAAIAWLMVILTSIYHLILSAKSRSIHIPVYLLLLAWLSVAMVGFFDHFWLTIYPTNLTIPLLLALSWYYVKSSFNHHTHNTS